MKTFIFAAITLAMAFIGMASARSQTWIQSTNAPNKEWFAVASSADGTKLVAAAYGGGIYTSTNSGLTWIPNNAPNEDWYCVVSSADGTKLAAGIDIGLSTGAGIYTNAGINWAETSAPNHFEPWYDIAGSTNGNNLLACGAMAASPIQHVVYISKDSGYSWNNVGLPNLYWAAVASSADGTKLVALANGTNIFYSSSDSGTTWVSNSLPNNTWYCVASSANGTKLTAGSGQALNGASVRDGLLYTSTNSGATWTPGNAPSQFWYSIASSSDGNKLVACAPGLGVIYSSADSGQTWISNNVPTYEWASVASSADGSKLVAVSFNGQIYTAQPVSPTLSCQLSGTNFILSWPAATTGFQLQQSLTLMTNSWAIAVNLSNGQNQVIVPATNKQTFYRLISQ